MLSEMSKGIQELCKTSVGITVQTEKLKSINAESGMLTGIIMLPENFVEFSIYGRRLGVDQN